MRHALLVLSAVSWMGCGGSDCLPVPESDGTDPEPHLAVEFVMDGNEQTAVLAASDSQRTVSATAGHPIRVRYSAHDEQGLRSVALGAVWQRTVGVGVERDYEDLPPVDSDCPVADLTGNHTIPASQGTLLLSVSAENWKGRRTVTPNLTVHVTE